MVRKEKAFQMEKTANNICIWCTTMYENLFAWNWPPSLNVSIFLNTVELSVCFTLCFLFGQKLSRSLSMVFVWLFSFFGSFSFTDWLKSFCNRENPWHWLLILKYTSLFFFYNTSWVSHQVSLKTQFSLDHFPLLTIYVPLNRWLKATKLVRLQ